MRIEAVALSLHPEHLADLRHSGLSDETIAQAGIRSLAPAEFPRFLGPSLAAKIESCYLIPYPEADGFYRVKLFPPIPDKDGHTVRYYQPAGTAPRLYLSPRARAALADPAIPLSITEGEKKGLKADQEGLACAALGGLWSWLLHGQPFPDLGRVDWYEREVPLVPDSEVWIRPDLLQAVYALGKELEARGAKVAVVKLPPGEGGGKVGLDDYLLGHGLDEFHRLPRLPLDHKLWTKTAEWWKGWRKRKDATEEKTAGAIELLERGETARTLHPAQDVADGILYYGFQHEKDLVVVTSRRETFRADQAPAGLGLRHAEPGPSCISRAAALQWLTKGTRGSVAKVLDDLAAFYARYAVFRDKHDPLLLAAWTLGTYCYRAFKGFPYLHLRSATRRCGKTRVLNLIALVGFNAGPPTTIPTEAQLYRAAERTGGVQLFDEMDKLRGDQERFEAVISVLNTGFEAGGVVMRLERRGERFVEIPYATYAPRALAGLSGLKDTLEDRVLPVFMLRKRRNEPVARLTRVVEAEGQKLRDQCALAALDRIRDIVSAYEVAHGLLDSKAIDDRAVDLWNPLVALALVADAEGEGAGDRTARLLALARDLARVRDADAEEGTTPRLIEALVATREAKGEIVTPTELLAAIRERGLDWIRSTRALAGQLESLGLFSGRVKREGKVFRAYTLDPDVLADLRARWVSSPSAASEDGS